jgi:acyl transferase domain-containing protein/acyl carrier protein
MFPMAEDLAHFWSNIRGRLDAITEVPPTHWRPEDYWDEDPKAADRTYARRGGFLTPVDFPLLDFGIPPHAVEATDTTQLLGLLVARQALLDAGYGPSRNFARDRVSVILGVTGTLELVIPLGARLGHPIWRRALREAGVDETTAEDVVRRIAGSYHGWQENSFPGLLGNVAAGRIANRLDLGGTNCVVDAACASSLGAINLAMLELAAMRCDVALSGGLDTFNDIFMYMCFSKTPALSPTGNARPFDAAADGTILGEGLGILVLKRLEDARRDGDRIYAVIRSMGTSSDGKGQAVYAPSVAGQVSALRQAYDLAGVAPGSIELVEAHGTGTNVGDAIELEALEQVYRGARPGGPWCALGSIKSQVGHTKAAAGAAGLIKAALAIYHKVLPPTIKVRQPIEHLASGESPFYLNTESRPWLPCRSHPRRAGVSAFGFGGSNFHCVLEEAQSDMPSIDWGGDIQILAYSSDDPDRLVTALPRWKGEIAWPEVRLEGARSRASFCPEQAHRLVLVLRRGATDPAGLLEQAAHLRMVPSDESAHAGQSRELLVGTGPAKGPLAMLFPGQGSQYVGMLCDLACRFPAMQTALSLWDGLVGPDEPRLSETIYPPAAFRAEDRQRQDELLRDTRFAQPAIGAVSLGLFHVLADFGVRPALVGGHSFGELTSLHAAGRIDERALAKLSVRRGTLMADCAPSDDPGAMLAVLAPVDQVATLIQDHDLDVVIANKNAPRQCVLSGPRREVERAAKRLGEKRIPNRALAVSAAFHSRFVAHAQAAFRSELDLFDLMPAAVPVFANSTGDPYPEDAEEARELLADQLSHPVDFVAQIEAMYRMGARTFVEVGPDSKLTGLVRLILAGRDHVALALDDSRGEAAGGNLADLAFALANLSALGYPVKLARWDDGFEAPAPVSSRKGLTVKVCGANPSPTRPAASVAASTAPQAAGLIRDPVPTSPQSGCCVLPEPIVKPFEPNHHAASNGKAASATSAATAAARPPAADFPAPPSSAAGQGFLTAAIRQSQENLLGLQHLAEETARLHRQFLEGQAAIQRIFHSLLQQQEQLTRAARGLPESRVEESPMPSPPTLSPGPAPEQTHGAIPILSSTTDSVPASPDGPALRLESSRPAVATALDAIAPVLLHVVSEKTGYPVDMLELEMQLDVDLGIDSIKRVEILSTLQDRWPDAPPIQPEQLGSLRTLRQIALFLASPAEETSVALVPRPGRNGDLYPSSTMPTVAVRAPGSADVLLEVVSEKTGFPVDMLELDMQLDVDLGIDSIKRVEILSALQDRFPDGPAIKPEDLGSLRTLRQIALFLAPGTEHVGGVSVPRPSRNGDPHMPSSRPEAAPSSSEFAGILLALVSEKTGYPMEMLELDMQLDADLGIDSIKRVEILSALQDQVPHAPWVKPEHLGSLRTLREIADFLAGSPEQVTRDERPRASAKRALPVAAPTASLQCLAPRTVPLHGEDRGEVLAIAPGGEIWLTDDGSPLTEAVRSRLSRLDNPVRVIRAEQSRSLVPGELVAGLVLLAPANRTERFAVEDAFRLIQTAGPALRRAGAQGGSVLLTVSRLDGSFGLGGLDVLIDPASGALAGLTKTAAWEWPEVHCKAVDLDSAFGSVETAATQVVAEMLLKGPVEVGLTQAGATRIELVPMPHEETSCDPAQMLHSGDLVVASGGARGITAEVAVALAASFQPRLVLLGRTPAPEAEPDWLAPLKTDAAILRAIRDHAGRSSSPQVIHERLRLLRSQREIRRNLERIEAAGSAVAYHAVDVRDRVAVARVLEQACRQSGPLRGLIHGAGVLADRRIEDQTDIQFAQVLETKVGGLQALLESANPRALRFLALFSSSTARFGRVGQAAYAAANEFLNKWAQREAKQLKGCRTVAFNWGPWAGGMVTDTLRPMFEREGLGLIPLADGARLFVDEIQRTGPRPIEVVVMATPPAPASAGPIEPAPTQKQHESNGTTEPVLERKIDLGSLPVIRSHVIDGHAVLPLALILEWMAEGALQRNPGMVVVGVDQLRLFKGVVLRGHDPTVVSIRVGRLTRRGQSQIVAVVMEGVLEGGRPVTHARGEVILADRHLPGQRRLTETDLFPLAIDRDEIYRRVLFHGPALQAIQLVEGYDDRAIAAWVSTSPPPASWIERPLRQCWLTDPLAIDAAFQVLVLWTAERLGSNSLPTAIGSYHQFRRSFPTEGVRVLAAVREFSEHRAVADIEFLDAQGQPVAWIESYECVIDSSLNQAFRRNRLSQLEVASS